jgi:ribosomal protein S8
MTARFPAMIATMRNSIKTGAHSCSVPVNTLCLRVLELLRSHGFIQGYSHLYTRRQLRQGFNHGYPRVTIVFKYTDHNSPILKDIQSFKRTHSNFLTLNPKHQSKLFMSDHLAYILSSPQGLKMTFSSSLKESQGNSSVNHLKGILIAQLTL